MSLQDQLRRRRVPAEAERSHRARLFDPSVREQAEALQRLLREQPHVRVRDTLHRQVAELLATRRPRDPEAGSDGAVAAFLAEHGGPNFGLWAYYPWRAELLHLLPPRAFVELRSNRNQLSITAGEQRRLRDKRIALVGLSVGHSMAVTMALEGVGGSFLLADPDELELSNTNRVPAGLSSLGANKARLAAQRIAEIDPYLDVAIWPAGIDRGDPDRLFRDFGPDLLIEECDDLVLKLALRERARTHRVPVITETSQRGLIDVERFDLEPDRPVLHGLLGGVDAASLGNLSTREKAPFGLRYLQGVEAMTDRFAGSLLEIDETLSGWPQLGSAVTLGGAVVTDVARRVLLEQFCQSGRFHVDVAGLVADESPANELPSPVAPEPTLPLSPVASVEPGAFLGEGIRGWLRAAILAPSGGNSQPWRFRILGERSLACRIDPERAISALDPRGLAAYLACGAAFEHLRLAAAADGQRARVQWQAGAGDGRVFEVTFERTEDPPDPLWEQIGRRCTNRRTGERVVLGANVVERLRRRAREADARLHWIDEPGELQRVAEVLGELERIRVLSPALHREMVAELRIGPGSEQAEEGIAEATLELTDSGRAALAVLRRPDVAALLAGEDAGAGLRRLAHTAIDGASAFARLQVPGCDPLHFAHGGAALARVWLEATAQGLSIQPMSAGAFMVAQLDLDPERTRLQAQDWRRLEAVRPVYQECFPYQNGHADALLFRILVADSVTARSGRRPVDEVLDD